VSPRDSTVEQLIGRIASRAHGVATWGELRAAGVSEAEIKWRIQTGHLLRVYRGVYRVGHRAPNVEAQYMAAVKACGGGAGLSGLAAAHLYWLVKEIAMPEVAAPTERRVRGVITHRVRDLVVVRHRGIPITPVPPTLIAIASRLDDPELGKAVHQARVLYGTKPMDFPGRIPVNLRRILYGDTRITLSELERRFLELLRAHNLPLPQTNRVASGRYVDCRWPEYGLTVELHGYIAHDSRHAWQLDRRREREAYRRGDDFRQYTWDDVALDPTDMLNELHALLRRYPVTASARSSAG
jgi:Transcriptional regulator, AbiEi antitoxin